MEKIKILSKIDLLYYVLKNYLLLFRSLKWKCKLLRQFKI